jgi:hypothetical protein
MDLGKTPMREKYWSEIDESEKVERIRREVKTLIMRVDRLMNKMERIESHSHLDGELVVPLRSNIIESERPNRSHGPNTDDVYF